MVNLTKIYTRTGDAGQTRLTNNEVAAKTDARVNAYGDVDEANSAIGVLLANASDAASGVSDDIRAVLSYIQNELFDVGADLSNPVVANPKWEPLRVIESEIDRLESWCDQFSEQLPKLRSFILPGGCPAAAQLHMCRTLVRRAERSAWAAAEQFGLEDGQGQPSGGVNQLAIKYLNRLSDLLFILARAVNANAGADEVLWVPGGERNDGLPKRKRRVVYPDQTDDASQEPAD